MQASPPPPPPTEPAPGHRARTASPRPIPDAKPRSPRPPPEPTHRPWRPSDLRAWFPTTTAARRALMGDLVILGAGLGSTIGVLTLYYGVGAPSVLGLYTFSLPVGALFMGLMAGSGYGLAGFFMTGLRFRLWMIIGVIASMFIAYWGVEYLHYLEHGYHHMGFLGWYDLFTRNAVWIGELGESAPMGWSGYNFRFLEMVGMMVGGFGGLMIVPLLAVARA